MEQTNNQAADSSGPRKRAHQAWLDSARAFAALWVVAHHAYLTVTFKANGLLPRVAQHWLIHGHLAVTVFIAVSGYSLALQVASTDWRLKDGYREFMSSRIIRIVPPYYASIALSLICIAAYIGAKTGTHWDLSIPVSTSDIIKHLLMVQNFSGAPKINHVFWSISLEFQIYLFFGLILAALRRFNYYGAIGIAMLLSGASALLYSLLGMLFPARLLYADTSLIAYFPVFVFGVLACKLAHDEPEFGRKRGVPLFLCATLVCIGATMLRSTWQDLIFGSSVAVALYSVATNDRLRVTASYRAFAVLGAFAYSLYLTHAFVLQILFQAMRSFKPTDTLTHSIEFLCLSLPICLIVAYAFYISCERPCFKLRHLLRRRNNK
jgi:peptidoglycan/LPS O-acetylase OafA/YrhL